MTACPAVSQLIIFTLGDSSLLQCYSIVGSCRATFLMADGRDRHLRLTYGIQECHMGGDESCLAFAGEEFLSIPAI